MVGRVSASRLPTFVPYLFLYNVVNTYYYASYNSRLAIYFELRTRLHAPLCALPSDQWTWTYASALADRRDDTAWKGGGGVEKGAGGLRRVMLRQTCAVTRRNGNASWYGQHRNVGSHRVRLRSYSVDFSAGTGILSLS